MIHEMPAQQLCVAFIASQHPTPMGKDLSEQRFAGAGQIDQINRAANMLREIGNQRQLRIGGQRLICSYGQVEIAVGPRWTGSQRTKVAGKRQMAAGL